MFRGIFGLPVLPVLQGEAREFCAAPTKFNSLQQLEKAKIRRRLTRRKKALRKACCKLLIKILRQPRCDIKHVQLTKDVFLDKRYLLHKFLKKKNNSSIFLSLRHADRDRHPEF